MALADLILEGLTLILVIALGAVLIGGLTYLSTTVASTNEAKLVGMGTYVYIPAAVYVNGTLYVPMYNIGHYTVVVRQLFIMVGNTLISQTLNTTLAPGQYYVYTTTLNQRPTAVTVVASPTVEPRLKLEFSANVTEPGQVELTPISTSMGGDLIEVVVNDVYGAGWAVSWSYADQSYSVSESTSYTWFINPPYVPIQITFNAQITNNPSGYTCQMQPSQVTNTYGPGSKQVFDVVCGQGNEYFVYVTVTNDSLGASWIISSSVASISNNTDITNTELAIGGTNDTLIASITQNPAGYYCTINPSSEEVQAGESYTFTVDCQKQTQTVTYYFEVQVTNDTLGAGWSITYSYYSNGYITKTASGDSDWSSGPIAIQGVPNVAPPVTFSASITSNPSGYECSIGGPSSIAVTSTSSSSPTIAKFTVSCVKVSTSPPPQVYGCLFTFSLGSSPNGAPTPSYSGTGPGTYFIPSGQSVGGSVSAYSSESISSGGSGSSWWEFEDYTLSFSGSGTLYFNGVSMGPGTWNYGNPSRTYFGWQFDCPSSLSQNVTASFSATANYVKDYVTLSGPTSVSSPGDYTYTLSWNIWPGNANEESWSIPDPNGNPFEVVATLIASTGTYSVTYSTTISCNNGVIPKNIQVTIVSNQTGVTGTQNSAAATINVQYLCPLNRGGT